MRLAARSAEIAVAFREARMAERVEREISKTDIDTRLLVQGRLLNRQLWVGAGKTHFEVAANCLISSSTSARFDKGIDRRAFAVIP